MSAAVAVPQPEVLHAIPGRVRLSLPGWSGQGQRSIESRLGEMPGVRLVRANPVSGTVLIQFDPRKGRQESIVAAVRELAPDRGARVPITLDTPPAINERAGERRRVRIAVRGLNRDPDLVRRVEERLSERPGIGRLRANPLTGRVLVEFDSSQVSVAELVADVSALETEPQPTDERPAHPLERDPLLRSVARVSGATIGFAFLTLRQLLGRVGPVAGSRQSAENAAIVSVTLSLPIVRQGLRRLLGQTSADLLLAATSSISLAFSGNWIGLSLSAIEGFLAGSTAYSKRASWQRHEAVEEMTAPARPGATLRFEADDRTPRAAMILDGTGTAIGLDGLPVPLAPGHVAPAGARLFGGPFVAQLLAGESYVPPVRSTPVRESIVQRYLKANGIATLAYAGLTALLTRSPSRALSTVLIFNPRTAVTGSESAEAAAWTRAIRGGATVVGTRPARRLSRPDLLLLASPRLLSDGLELASVLPLTDDYSVEDIQRRAAAIALAAGSPWGGAFATPVVEVLTDGLFDGEIAGASLDGVRYTLAPLTESDSQAGTERLQERGEYVLLLRREEEPRPVGVIGLRPKLAPDVEVLVTACQQHGIDLALVAGGNPRAAEAIARRAGLNPEVFDVSLDAIRTIQDRGGAVALVADSADAAADFDLCDLAIGLTDGRSEFPARADLLAPDLTAVAEIVAAASRREAAVRDSILLASFANLAGAIWGIRRRPGLLRASTFVYATALVALADSWLWQRGGDRPQWATARFVDPRPERWGRRDIASVMRTLETSEKGLTSAEAAERMLPPASESKGDSLWRPLVNELRSPLTGVLAGGALISLATGRALDAVMIGGVIAANVAMGAWQNRMATRAAETVAQLGIPTARVLRDGQPVTLSASEVVPGDVLLIAAGDRVPADARLITAQGVEVDEAGLTGESLPVIKAPDAASDADRIVFDGTDVVAGVGRAIVVAVGPNTRLGATAAAMNVEREGTSPLDLRLQRILRLAIPTSLATGALVVAGGLLRRLPQLNVLQLGASIAVAAIPEGLPLLTQIGEAGVARRLVGRGAHVRRLPATEALGRVDVVCADKTGTLTEGRLTLKFVADLDRTVIPTNDLPADLRDILLAGAIASPHPERASAAAHPTDVAIANGALANGLEREVYIPHTAEAPFAPGRPFHAVVANERFCVKGAPEVIAACCDRVRADGVEQPLDPDRLQQLIDRGEALAGQGLRVLLVAVGEPDISPEEPAGLVALGFLCISDPLKANVHASVQECRKAGIRVIMLTGDHPITASVIGREAGLFEDDSELVKAIDLATLDLPALAKRLEHVSVIARATPLDKLRIIEGLQYRGHTVAMTGDGANDGPALRLADIGVAMSLGTEVARQASDVVITDFSQLVEALTEGRTFWYNIRRTLGLLVGGNFGVLGLLAAPSLLNLPIPFNSAQILAVNLISDALPGLAVTLQPPPEGGLSALAREGSTNIEAPLRRAMVRRALATAVPSIAAYLYALKAGTPQQAAAVAFGSVVATQIAQSLEVGWPDGQPNRAILGAVAASVSLLGITLLAPPARALLGLVAPTPVGLGLIVATAAAAFIINRTLSTVESLSENGDGPAALEPGRPLPNLALAYGLFGIVFGQ